MSGVFQPNIFQHNVFQVTWPSLAHHLVAAAAVRGGMWAEVEVHDSASGLLIVRSKSYADVEVRPDAMATLIVVRATPGAEVVVQ